MLADDPRWRLTSSSLVVRQKSSTGNSDMPRGGRRWNCRSFSSINTQSARETENMNKDHLKRPHIRKPIFVLIPFLIDTTENEPGVIVLLNLCCPSLHTCTMSTFPFTRALKSTFLSFFKLNYS